MATAVVAGSLALAGGLTLPAEAASNNNTSKKLRQAVTLAGLEEHLQAFQEIADENGGNRFSGLPGYDASVDYAKQVFEKAGYKVTVQPFEYLASFIEGPATLQRTAPEPLVTYEEDVDYTYLSQTDPGDVEAAVTPVDLALGEGNKSTSGCEAGDFAGFPAGNIALIQRGTCTFEQKIENAAAAGAVGVVFFNQGDDLDDPSRTGLVGITLGAGNTSGIPALLATYARGVEWSQTQGLRMRIVTDTVRETKTTSNVLAESRWGDKGDVVMAGAHLDSVPEGPGINDNGTGSAAILEVAEQMRKVHTKDRVRFALWGAEESGLVGSTHYVNSLSDDQLDKIDLYLNFDMIGSPNFVRFVYDGDNSAFEPSSSIAEGPEGSGDIEQMFHDYFASQGLESAESGFTGRSDYGPFIAEGIPSGGLFTGAEGIKTVEEAAIFGGTAGVAYDPCYHQECDDIDNVNRTGFHQMADAVAHAVLTAAMDGRPVSPPGRHVTGTPTTAEPAGGDEHDHGEVR